MAVCWICVDDFSIEPRYAEPIPSRSTLFDSNPTSGVVATICGHLFHYSCLSIWLSKVGLNTCPYCCSKIPPKSIIKIYHDWDRDNGVGPEPPSKSGLVNLKIKLEKARNTLNNSNSNNRIMKQTLDSYQKKSEKLLEAILCEKNLSTNYKKLYEQSQLTVKPSEEQLMQAMACLKAIEFVANQQEPVLINITALNSTFLDPHYKSVFQSVLSLRDRYLAESRLLERIHNKYLSEVDAHRKTQEKGISFKQFLARIF